MLIGPVPAPAPVSKHAYDQEIVPFDWHDFLANQWEAGVAVAVNYAVRPLRAAATGLEYKVTTAGVTSGSVPPTWPTASGQTVTDGTAVWTAQAPSGASMRTTIATSAFSCTLADVTLTPETVADFVYPVLVAAGISRHAYQIVNQVVLADGEEREATCRVEVVD